MKKGRGENPLKGIIPDTNCPICKHKLDAATIVSSDKEIPVPGDFSVCIYCASLLRFNGQLYLDLTNMQDVPPEMRHKVLQLIGIAKKMIHERVRKN